MQPRMGRLVIDGEQRSLEKKAMELLSFLAEQGGAVATREEIIEAIWPQVAVTEHSLNRLVSALRKALDDDAGDPRLLLTIRGVGYRLKGPIGTPAQKAAVDPPPRKKPAAPRSRRLPGMLAAIFLLAVSTVSWVLLASSRSSPERETAIEVIAPATTTPAPTSTRSPRLLDSALDAFSLAGGKLDRAEAGAESLDLALEAAAELVRVGRPREAEELLRRVGERLDPDSQIPSATGTMVERPADELLRLSTYHRLRADILTYESRLHEGLEHAESALAFAHSAGDEKSGSEAALRARLLAALIVGETQAELGEERGIRLIKEELELAQRRAGIESELVTRALCALGAAYFYQRRLLEAETYIGQCGTSTARTSGAESLEYARYEAFAGALHWARDDLDAAARQSRSSLERAERLLGSLESQLVVDQLSSLGTLAWMDGELLIAETRLRDALALSDRVLGEDSRPSTTILQSLSIALRRAGRLEEAGRVQRRNIEIRRRAGHTPLDLATAYQQLASILREQGDARGAVPWALLALDIRREHHGERNLLTASSQMELGRCLLALGERERAVQVLAAMLETREKRLPEDSPLLRESRDLLFEALRAEESSPERLEARKD